MYFTLYPRPCSPWSLLHSPHCPLHISLYIIESPYLPSPVNQVPLSSLYPHRSLFPSFLAPAFFPVHYASLTIVSPPFHLLPPISILQSPVSIRPTPRTNFSPEYVHILLSTYFFLCISCSFYHGLLSILSIQTFVPIGHTQRYAFYLPHITLRSCSSPSFLHPPHYSRTPFTPHILISVHRSQLTVFSLLLPNPFMHHSLLCGRTLCSIPVVHG